MEAKRVSRLTEIAEGADKIVVRHPEFLAKLGADTFGQLGLAQIVNQVRGHLALPITVEDARLPPGEGETGKDVLHALPENSENAVARVNANLN